MPGTFTASFGATVTVTDPTVPSVGLAVAVCGAPSTTPAATTEKHVFITTASRGERHRLVVANTGNLDSKWRGMNLIFSRQPQELRPMHQRRQSGRGCVPPHWCGSN